MTTYKGKSHRREGMCSQITNSKHSKDKKKETSKHTFPNNNLNSEFRMVAENKLF